MLLAEMTWLQVQALDPNTPVLLPIAAHEQHGHHLPLFTDSDLLGEIVRRTEEAVSPQVLITPLQWLGNSHHHRDFPGTLSAAPRLYLDLLQGLVEDLLDMGFHRILLLNGHGGNEVPAQQALFELRQRHRQRSDLLLLMSSYWKLPTEPVEPSAGLRQSEMGHACEWETSMMLALKPHLVGAALDWAGLDGAGLESLEPVDQQGSFLPAYRPWVTQDRSTSGHIGYPHLATAAKGEYLFRRFSHAVQVLVGRLRDWDGTPWSA